MQTFLPLPSYRDSVRVLDPSRLVNQVYREAMTLIRGGWKNHPASRMWRGHRDQLILYALAGIDELRVRGREYPHIEHELLQLLESETPTKEPFWLGDDSFHASHRSNLLRKYPAWYGQFGWSEPDNLLYIWPDPTQVIQPTRNQVQLKIGKRI